MTNIVNLAMRRFGEILKKKSAAAGTKIGTGMKKAVSFSGTRVRKSGHDSQMEKQEQPKIEREHEIPVETSRVEKPSLDTQEYGHVTPNVSAPSVQFSLVFQGSGLSGNSGRVFDL